MKESSFDRNAYLRRRLLDRERTLAREVEAERAQPVGEGEGTTAARGDPGDEAVAGAANDLRLLETARDLAELSAIGQALARMEAGTYGTCDDCGARIEFERLQAQPIATLCIDCQERRERMYAHPHIPTL
jgi:DnaK suppressor protein